MRKITSPRAFKFIMALAFYSAISSHTGAHEYWIEPLEFQVKPDTEIIANQKVGQNFKGNKYPLIPQEFTRSGLFSTSGKIQFKGDIGDIPALRARPQHAGLHVLAVATKSDELTYETPEKFQTFLKNQGLEWALIEHRKRGLPDAGFTEAYSRYAKALVQVGPPGGTDVTIGLPIELIAEKNPYTITLNSTAKLPVRLLWQGKPLRQAQIKIFHRANDKLIISKIRTDDTGRAMIPLSQSGKYLLSAVHIIPWKKSPKAVWHSFWASMTFNLGR